MDIFLLWDIIQCNVIYSVALIVPVWAVSRVLVGFYVLVMVANPLFSKPFFTF